MSESFRVVGKGQVLIVKGSPTPGERLRDEPFINNERALLKRFVLDPAGLTRDDVMLAWCEDPAELEAFIKSSEVPVVVSLSRLVRLEKEKGRWNFPELAEAAAAEEKFAPELARKVVALRKALDTHSRTPACSLAMVTKAATATDASHIAPIKKSKAQERIVYGVVLDPYQVDAHNDWIPPAEIEKTAIRFMKHSRIITEDHKKVAPDAVLVENFVEAYPSDSDREKAHSNEPHRAFARDFGSDRIHSGAWVMGVQLSERLWERYEKGELGAFSIEGFGVRENLTMAAMPKVTFVELGEVGTIHGQEDSKTRPA
jgi:hypothetical protein